MKLTVFERLRLGGILPESGSVDTIRIVHDLIQTLGLTEEEYERYGVHSDENNPERLVWNSEIPQETEIEIGKKAKKVIRDALIQLDESQGVTVDLIPLFDKFVSEGDE